jgi:two-component system cell cycle sensor histidine kinase PleC
LPDDKIIAIIILMAHINGQRGGTASVKGMKAELEYLSRMSHGFRTPLNIIIGFTELMLDEVPGKINEDQRRSLNDILDSARRLLDIVDGMPEHQ